MIYFLRFFIDATFSLNGNVIIDATYHKWILFHHKNLKILLKSGGPPPSLLKYSYFFLNKCFFIQKVVVPYFLSLPFLKTLHFLYVARIKTRRKYIIICYCLRKSHRCNVTSGEKIEKNLNITLSVR